ncbi:Chain A, Methionine Gamma-Lyase [Tritrichomonas foetus]|uniref:L-methionine gamma-lyase n=1 Tax=Tritrichomonas foetus TaxID=1144522 RepID=A0A1J4JN63_9EUKA|nr:Chain A, Methionine Gamma-Lyase [Tritrichomonas foetus]|eukprot:OHT00567.1 Chain A, Methionine Gamma-Lyase [Tritrichomonas foetus]
MKKLNNTKSSSLLRDHFFDSFISSNHSYKMTEELMSMETQVIHANHQKDQYGAVVPPIYQTSTFVFDSAEQGGRRFAGEESGYIYTRLGNPTTANLEGKLATLECAESAACVSSGMAAIASTVLTLLQSGDHIISDDTLYGCTHSLFEHQLRKFGIEVDFIDASKPGEVKKHMKPNTKIVFFETPANPTLKIIDIQQVVHEAHSQEGVFVVVDNTFNSPITTRPIKFGADIVVHSMTKYLNGHTDVVGGCICSTKQIIDKIKCEGIKDITGGVLSPHDAFLVIRGLMTLDLRVRKASANAMIMAEFLENHPAVEKVYYPGLESHHNHDVAARQMDTFGSMITFELKGGLEAGKRLLNTLKLMVLAVSLGGCETLIQHPASMTHACVPREEREAAGLTDGMIRLSVGIEGIDDLISDIKQALDGLL